MTGATVPRPAGRTALTIGGRPPEDRDDMQVQISDRTHRLPAELRAYVDEKVKSLGDHLDLIAGADVEFIRDLKKRPEPVHVVKINLHLLGHRLPGLRVSETGLDPRVTFDVALARISDEVDQLKERVKAHP